VNLDSLSRNRVRLRQRFRAETQAAILAAAEEVFAERGLHQARMESIAVRAGVAVGTLYNHFQDREALLAALVRSRRKALLDRVDLALAGAEGAPFEDALAAFLAALFGHWAEHAGLLTALLYADQLGRPAPGEGRGRRMADELARRVDRVLRRGVAEGRLRPEGSEDYPALLMGMARGLLVQGAGARRAPDGGAAARVLKLFLRGAGS
jgi:AcrR family transcriptional regulator